jgi:hypothetical protein
VWAEAFSLSSRCSRNSGSSSVIGCHNRRSGGQESFSFLV